MTDTAAIFTVCSINSWSVYKILENLMTSNDQINLRVSYINFIKTAEFLNFSKKMLSNIRQRNLLQSKQKKTNQTPKPITKQYSKLSKPLF